MIEVTIVYRPILVDSLSLEIQIATIEYTYPDSMLNKLQEAYETAILESSSTLTSVENGLRQLTWFLPGRFEDAEIASEGRE